MVQLLIVDDDIYTVEAIRSAINWRKLGVKQIFTALNARQAKQVFEQNKIDIMLCDIEMPQENGFSLLGWAKENHPEIECIFLTSHAEFNYAQKAIQLNSYDYILKPVPFPVLENVISKLINKLNKEYVMRKYQEFWANNHPINAQKYKMPDMDMWAVILRDGAKDDLFSGIYSFLQDLSKTNCLNANNLERFQQDFLQMIYSTLKYEGVKAHELFDDGESKRIFEKATHSIKDLMYWIQYTVEKTHPYINKGDDKQLTLEKVKSFIKSNLDKSLTRTEIAEQVHLNPDYLNRIFKKETGMSIKQFLSHERIELAKKLLASTDIPVSVVALNAGYHNFSHFSKTFKNFTGLNPVVFRQRHSSSDEQISFAK